MSKTKARASAAGFGESGYVMGIDFTSHGDIVVTIQTFYEFLALVPQI
jgi:hypothetical protein